MEEGIAPPSRRAWGVVTGIVARMREPALEEKSRRILPPLRDQSPLEPSLLLCSIATATL
ncbi:hypothetical protein AHAS_Ahas06G0198500 [Arachis hypogaea]